jgi:hypothetical protein
LASPIYPRLVTFTPSSSDFSFLLFSATKFNGFALFYTPIERELNFLSIGVNLFFNYLTAGQEKAKTRQKKEFEMGVKTVFVL